MNLLLVAATPIEIRPLTVQLIQVEKQSDQVTAYHLNNMVIDLLVSGVGMVHTAYYLGRQLAQKKYDLAINAGIAGTFTKSLPLGTVVQVVEDGVSDLGAEDGENFRSVFELGLADPDRHPYSGGRLVNDPPGSGGMLDNEIIRNLPRVKAITSNTVHGNAAHISRIQRISSPGVETMEGAAFFFACISAGVPCLQIRSVSNLVEERDKSRWNIDLAVKNLNKVLWDIITSYPGGG